MYDECIESIENKGFGSNGIVGWIQFYKQDVEKMKSDFRTTPVYRVTSVDSELDDAPPLVKDIYREYKSRNPLLHGGENSVSMVLVVKTGSDLTKRQNNILSF